MIRIRTAALVVLVATFAAPFAHAAEGGAAAQPPKTSDKVVVDRARVLRRPAFPSDARNQGVAGTVAVRVVVGPDGDVLSARAVAGPEALRAAAVAAARSWEFTTTEAPDTLSGTLLFKFGAGSSYASIVGVPDDDDAVDAVASAAPAPSSVSAPVAATPAAPTQAAPPAAPTSRRVSDVALVASAKKKVSPQYPAGARAAHVEGAVVVEVEIDRTGKVTSARALSGNAMLRDAAIAAAKQWTFAPPATDAAPTVGTINFNFKL